MSSIETPPPLTITNATVDGEGVAVRCLDGLIESIGPATTPVAEDVVIDAEGCQIVEATVNGHTHAAMTLFRGIGDDLPLMQWLREKIWPIEARIDAEDIYWGTRLACLEMIRTGTTRFWDMYWEPESGAQAILDSGLSAVVGAPLIDVQDGPGALRERALESIRTLSGFGNRIGACLAPHAIYTVSPESLRLIGELSIEHEMPIEIHLSETEEEVAECLDLHGVRPAFHLDACGVLTDRTLLAHGVWLDRAELELIAERGATVVTNPVANMKLAVGAAFPLPTARDTGVSIGMGTDGPGSNNGLDMISDLKMLALIQKHSNADAAVIGTREVWEIATGQNAPLLGGNERGLRAGAAADLLILRSDSTELSVGSLHAGLVYAASGSIVRSTIAGGAVVMRDGIIENSDEVIAKAKERAARLGLA